VQTVRGPIRVPTVIVAVNYDKVPRKRPKLSQASVMIPGAIKATIQHGLMVLLAIEESDVAEDTEWLSGKIVRLRIFNDEQGLMNRSVQQMGGEILLVSQFTLFASTKKGNRPSFAPVLREKDHAGLGPGGRPLPPTRKWN